MLISNGVKPRHIQWYSRKRQAKKLRYRIKVSTQKNYLKKVTRMDLKNQYKTRIEMAYSCPQIAKF